MKIAKFFNDKIFILGKRIWNGNDLKKSFREMNLIDWVEIQSDKLFATFRCVEANGDTVTILDENRNLYISLDSNNAKWGISKNTINNLLVNGQWLILKNYISTDKKSSFQQTTPIDWVEISNDKVIHNFKFFEESGGVVILLDPSRNLYVSLNSNTAKWGSSKNNIPNVLFNGNWA